MSPTDRPRIGLRERKKAKTRAAIEAHAMRLFREQGYEATTVQQIIAAAEVSESTFFRYFPTKPDVVLADDLDPIIVAAFQAQPPELSIIQALRGAFRAAFAQLTAHEEAHQRERMILILTVAELRGAMLDQFASAMRMLTQIVAVRAGRTTDDPAVRTLAGAVIGVAMAVMFAVADDPSADLAALFDEAMGCLDEGLSL